MIGKISFIPILSFILPFLLPFLINTSNKNTCTSFGNYFLINFSDNCYYNPDVDLDVPELIEKYTGNLMSYKITTEDGYILTMYRIFQKNSIGVILLQPAIGTSSLSYLEDGNQSLAFKLWRKGYDIWLSNHRGGLHSRNHINLTDSDPNYWDFSFHEIALYDFNAQFNLIRNETNDSQIIYIGYSMSGTEALVYASMEPENSQKFIKSFILIGPTSIMINFNSPFKYLLYLMSPAEKIFRLGEFATFEFARWITQKMTITPYIIKYITSLIMGWTPEEMDPIFFPFTTKHYGRGVSLKTLHHFGQIYLNQEKFSLYDYGKERNMILYGSDFPPNYPLHKVIVPMYILYGENDALSTQTDVEILCNDLLPKGIVQEKVLIPYFNHVDVLFSKYREEKIYSNIFLFLDKIKEQNETKILIR